jgi:hypothetical protein
MIDTREALNLAGGFVAGGLILLLGFATWALVFREVPVSNRDAMMVVIGILSMNVGQVVSFFFGSSSTNKKQADTIDKQATSLAAAQAALAPAPENLVPVAPGESVTVKAEQQ